MKKWCLIAAAVMVAPVVCRALDGTIGWPWVQSVTNGTASGTYDYFDDVNWVNNIVASGAGFTCNATGNNRDDRTFVLYFERDLTIGTIKKHNRLALTFSNATEFASITFDNSPAAGFMDMGMNNGALMDFKIPVNFVNDLQLKATQAENRTTYFRFWQPVTGGENFHVTLEHKATSNYLFHMIFYKALSMNGSFTLSGLSTHAYPYQSVYFENANSYPGGSFLNACQLTVNSAGGLGSGDVHVGPQARLTLRASDAIGKDALLRIESEDVSGTTYFGKVDLGTTAAFTNTVRGLVLDNVKQPAGYYTSAEAPDYFMGNGVLRVLPPKGAIMMFK